MRAKGCYNAAEALEDRVLKTAGQPRWPTVARALRALAALAPESEGMTERYGRLLSFLRRRPAFAASGALAVALAAEALEAAERLIGPTDAGEAQPGSGVRKHRPRHASEFL
ncbi:MAG: hypothetical protein NTX87_00325 [Planctomycetota bacterium]|nr:hypothetical protein [Planctomycetota bacterium]